MRALVALVVVALGAVVSGSALSAPNAKPVAGGDEKTPASAGPLLRKPVQGELLAIAREAVAASSARLPKGARIVGVRTAAAVEIPVAPSRVAAEITPAPRRAGSVTTTAVLTFFRGADIASRLPVSLDLVVPPEALVFDLPKGTPVSLVVRRGLVEVTTSAVTSVDADLGDTIQVLVRPSGRALRARLVARDRAVADEEAR